MKKQLKGFSLFFSIVTAILFNCFVGVLAAGATGADPVLCMAGVNAIGVGIGTYATYSGMVPTAHSTMFFAGLAREVYLAEVLKSYRPDPAWLTEARNLSAYVQNDVINLADAGADPGVVVNFDSSYDLAVAADEDNPLALQLKTLSTEQTKIPWNTQRTRAYDIMADKVSRHQLALQTAMLRLAAYSIAPASNTANTPVMATTGSDTGTGFKAIKIDDLISFKTKFLNLDINLDQGLILVLNPQHLDSLQKEDKALFKALIDQEPGKSTNILGMKAYVSTATPLYNKSTGVRKAYGAVAAPSTDTISSFMFVKNEAGYAKGSMQAFTKMQDPARQADFFNFAHAYFAGSIRSKGIGAIYSPAA